MQKMAIALLLIMGLAIVATLICLLTLAPAATSFGANMENVWAIAKGVGISVAVGGLLILVLAICFTYNKPDPDLPPKQ